MTRHLLLALALVSCGSGNPHPEKVVAERVEPRGIDAPVEDPAPTPISTDELPTWPAPATTGAADVEVFAVDASIDEVLLALGAAAHPAGVILRAHGGTTTGKLATSSPAVALAAFAQAVGADADVATVKGAASPTIDMTRVGADGIDVVQQVERVLDHSAVVPIRLPELDVAVTHASAAGVLDAIASLVGRKVFHIRNLDLIVEPLAAIAPPPASMPTTLVDLRVVRGATAGQAAAALASVLRFPAGTCSTARLVNPLRLSQVRADDAARAIGVVSAALSRGTACAATETDDTTLLVHARLVAIAGAGAQRVAVFDDGQRTLVARHGHLIVIRTDSVDFPAEIDPTTSYLEPQHPIGGTSSTYRQWVTSLRRTSALVRVGAEWRAVIVTATGTEQLSSATPLAAYPAPMPAPPVFSHRGVELANPDASGPPVLIPFSR